MNRRSVCAQTVVDGCTTMVDEICWGGAIAYFYTRNLGLPMKTMAAVWAVFSFWNAVDNFIVGYITDRYKNGGGRRVDLIRRMGPVVGLCFALVFLRLPFLTSQTLLAVYAFGIICLLDFALAFLEGAVFALPLENTLSDKERGTVYLWQNLVDAAVLVVPTYLIPALRPKDGESALLFSSVMCVIGIVIGAVTFAASFFIDEAAEAPAAPARAAGDSWFRSVFGCMKSRAFWLCELLSVSLIAAYSIFTAGMYYYLDEVECSEILCYLALGAGILGMLAVSLGLHRTLGTKWLCVLDAGLSGGAMLAALLCPSGVLTGVLAFFGAGCAFVGNMYLLAFMMGDVADADDLKNNIRRNGIFFGIDTAFCSVANATQSVFMMMLLALGYVEGLPVGTQTPDAQHGLVVAWLLIPSAILLVAAVLIAWCYPLDKKQVAQIKSALEKRNAKEAV